MHQLPDDHNGSSSDDAAESTRCEKNLGLPQDQAADSAAEPEQIRQARWQFSMRHMDTTGCLIPAIMISVIALFSTLGTPSLTSAISSTFSGIVRELNKQNDHMHKQNL